MSAKFYEEIINNYKIFYETKEDYYDMKIYAGEKPYIKEFHVHSFVLKTQSEFFERRFTTNDDIDKKDGYFIINSSNSSKVFEIFLSYIYCGSIDLIKLQPREILDLLLPLDEFRIQPLVTHIQETLIKFHKELIYQGEFLNLLWNFCIHIICCDPDNLLFKPTTKFLALNPSILEIILRQDDFCIDNEIIIWEELLTCGQQPVIQQDLTNGIKMILR